MGEAKRKLEEVRAAMLSGLEEWSFEPTEWEANTVVELRLLPIVKVQRFNKVQLDYMRMPVRHCHVNAQFMEKNDPEQKTKQVVGWWIQMGNYVLHSVIRRDNQYFCVTPAPLEPEDTFDFIPDSKIEWREEGEYRSAYRDGVRIGNGVRGNPLNEIAKLQLIKQHLLSGMNPYEAVRRPKMDFEL